LVGVLSNSILLNFTQSPGIRHSGAFLLKKGKYMTIDYTKLNDRIVRQATEIPGFILSEEQKQKLFKNKIERAVKAIESRKTSPLFHTAR
jgi:hypothetical protein